MKTEDTPVRIAFVCNHDPDNPISISGMPYSIKQQLIKYADVTTILPSRGAGVQRQAQRRADALGLIPDFIKKPARNLVRAVRGDTPTGVEITPEEMFANAEEDSLEVGRKIREGNFDLVFVALSKSLLYKLDVDVPVVYFSDATARMINATYPKKMALSDAWREADDQLEREALHHSTVAIFPSSIACESAARDYGFENTVVIPMGANQAPKNWTEAPISEPPTRDEIRFCMTAADPVRKRLDLAVDIVGEMCKRGWNATLDYVGPTHPATEAPHVNYIGRLLLNDPADREKYWQITSDAHFLVLPTLGDAFALAAVEAAFVGTPGVVCDTGGLREIVLDGETGVLLPVDAPAEDYAVAIEEFAADPDFYTRAATKARDRAQVIFTWDHFGERVWEKIQEVIKGVGSTP